MTLKYANNAANSFKSFKDVSSQTQWPPFWGYPAFQQLPQNRPTFHTSCTEHIFGEQNRLELMLMSRYIMPVLSVVQQVDR